MVDHLLWQIRLADHQKVRCTVFTKTKKFTIQRLYQNVKKLLFSLNSFLVPLFSIGKIFLDFWMLVRLFFIKWVLIKNRTNVFLEINLSFDCIFLEIYFAALDLISLTLLKIFQPGFTFSKTGSSEIFFSCRSENLSVERKGQRKKSRRKRRWLLWKIENLKEKNPNVKSKGKGHVKVFKNKW